MREYHVCGRKRDIDPDPHGLPPYGQPDSFMKWLLDQDLGF